MNLGQSVKLAVLSCVATMAVMTWAVPVRAGFVLGDSANYAVLYTGAGGNQLNMNNGPGPNGLAVTGDVGIGGTGHLQLSGPLTLDGNVKFSGSIIDNGPYTGNIHVTGTITGNVGQVQTDITNLYNLSNTLGGEAGQLLSINLNNGQSQTINATSGNLINGDYVFNVSSMTFGNGATITINGTADQTVVFNMPFNAAFGGSIVLTGGITSDHVLWNITGGSNYSGGHSLTINTNGATVTGTFMDMNGAMSINHGVLNGRFFGGDSHDEQVVSGAYINAPTTQVQSVPEPSAFALLILGGIGSAIAPFRRRKLSAH